MTTEQYSENVKQCILELEKQVPVFVLSFGNNLTEDIKERINQKGIDAWGRSFPPLSDGYKKFKQAKVKHRKDTKVKNNSDKDVGFRNFSLFNTMLPNFKMYKEGAGFYMGFNSDIELKKAEGNSKYVGNNIIEPSEKEIDMQIDIFQEAILNLLKKYLA